MPTSPRPCHSEPVTVSLAWESVLPERETDCRVASLLAMTRCVGADDSVCPNSAKRCHSEPVTVSLAWESALPQIPPSKSQQFPAKFCAPIQNVKISPETVADGLRGCYIQPIHRKYTIYRHPWVSRAVADGDSANGILTKFYLHRRVLR